MSRAKETELTWSADELHKFGEADDLHVSPLRVGRGRAARQPAASANEGV
jgi:hypothetical protein